VPTAESVDQAADNNVLLAHADYGVAKLARTGADSDTLETLSDQIDGCPTNTELGTALAAALDAAFTDATELTANGLKDRIRTAMWILRNKMSVTNLNGNTVILKDDNSTEAISVNAALTDDSTTTVRLRLA